MRFIFSIFFIPALFLTPVSWGQRPEGYYCLDPNPTRNVCGLYTSNCRAPQRGENRAVNCECSQVWRDAIPHHKDIQELSYAFSLVTGVHFSRDKLYSTGIALNENRAKEDALNTCRNMLSDIVIPKIRKNGIPAKPQNWSFPNGVSPPRPASAERLITVLSSITSTQFQNASANAFCTKAFVCDKGKKLEVFDEDYTPPFNITCEIGGGNCREEWHNGESPQPSPFK